MRLTNFKLEAQKASQKESVSSREYWTISDLYKNIKDNNVEVAAFLDSGKKIKVLDKNGYTHVINTMENNIVSLEDLLTKNNVRYDIIPSVPPLLQALGNIIPVFFGFAVIGVFFRMMAMSSESPFSKIQGETKIDFEPETGVSFKDVAGCDESKLELKEVVDFLKYPENFTDIGAESPRGILLEGPPGTGKTLLARAVAGEAGVPFISASGSQFVEMFVGVGASRARKLFKDAKDNAPCIIFIDEIDSIGKSRSSGGVKGGNDEREQTLNQILAEMDGFDGNTGIIVLAATNRADILDSALLRPGRFDRRVPVGLPSKDGREAILKIHAKGKILDETVNLKEIAGRTIGFSGAALKNLMNEAAIVAVRRGKRAISTEELDYSIDRLTVGIQKPIGPNVRKELVAYHEAGHAVMAALLPDYDNVTKVTIIPRTNGAGGFTLFTPSEERVETGLYSQKYLKSQLCVALGGRVAEELIFGEDEITTGASGDLQKVRSLARQMITQWGFRNQTIIEDVPIAWEPVEYSPLSPYIQEKIDTEITNIVKHAYETCKETLKKNKHLLKLVAEELIEFETITGEVVHKLIQSEIRTDSSINHNSNIVP
jgi:cell division protease FtsH